MRRFMHVLMIAHYTEESMQMLKLARHVINQDGRQLEMRLNRNDQF